MNDHSEAFVAFDTSKLRNAVAIAEAGRSGEVRFVGEIDNTPTATAKLVAKLGSNTIGCCFATRPGRLDMGSSGRSRKDPVSTRH